MTKKSYCGILVVLLFFLFLSACDNEGEKQEGHDGKNGAETANAGGLKPLDSLEGEDGFLSEKDSSEMVYAGTNSGFINVEEIVDYGTDWSCSDWMGCDCVDDYLRFIDLAAEHARPIAEHVLRKQIEKADVADLITETIPTGQLRETLIDLLNIRFLRRSINERPLLVTVTYEEETDTYRERGLLFTDPYVGTFRGILLLPKTQGPHPAILALHGHGDMAEGFLENYYGKDYPSYGYAVLMLTQRAMCVDPNETLVTQSLLLNGFTFMGIRNYEALLGLKYLQYLDEVDGRRIGLIGHSGGSVSSNLNIRMEKGFRAYVSDCTGTYLDRDFDHMLDESAPAIWPYSALIRDFSTVPLPVLQVDYGYPAGLDEIVEFFDAHLR